MVGSWIAFVGFGLGILSTNNGLFEPLQASMRGWVAGDPESPNTLASSLGVNPWLVIILFVLPGALWLWKGRPPVYEGGWSWQATGTALGLIGTMAWLLSALSGRMYGLSVTEPTYQLMRLLAFSQSDAIGWSLFMLAGIPIGSYVAARRAAEFKWRAPGATRLLQALGGGMVMGIGAAIAGGCTVGHSLTGVSILSVTSLIASAGILLGVWSASATLFRS